MIELQIDEATPSLNVVWGGHWSHKTAMRKKWHWLVKAALLKGQYFEQPKYAKATVTIERYGARLLDADNARGGAKMLMDQLVRQGLILDDNPNVIGEPIVRQFAGKARKTIIRIEPT